MKQDFSGDTITDLDRAILEPGTGSLKQAVPLVVIVLALLLLISLAPKGR